MTIRNVQEYGATGNGRTDDTEAIQQAIDDAETGDTVLIPQTSEYYLVSTGNRAAVDFTDIADGVTISGEGENSMLRMGNTSDSRNQWVLGAEADKGPISGVTIKQLTLDGNRDQNGNTSTSGFNLFPAGGGHDIRIEDVIFQNCAGTGFSMRGAGSVTIRRVTSRNNGRHGYDFTGAGERLDVDARSVKSVNNDGTGIDFHSGNHRVEDVYCDNNRSGTKLGASGGAADSVVLRNANLRNARENSGFRETMPSGSSPDVTLDTVQVVSPASEAFRLTNAANYTITEILAHNGGHSQYNIRIDRDATINADVIRSQHADSVGLFNYSRAASSVSEYYHYATASPLEDGRGTLRVETQTERESEFLDVPGEDDVGAFTRTATAPADEEETTYQTNFSAYQLDATPSDWTPRYASSSDDWTVRSETSPIGSTVLRFEATDSARHALSYDPAGTVADGELLGLFRVADLTQGPTAGGRLILRGSGNEGTESSYFFNVRDEQFGLWKYVNGDSDRLFEWGQPDESQWYFVRIRAAGDQLRARVWPSGTDEPESWDADLEDTDLSAGWVGVGSFSEFADDWAFVSVGVGGATAPLPGRQPVEYSQHAVIQTLDGTIKTD